MVNVYWTLRWEELDEIFELSEVMDPFDDLCWVLCPEEYRRRELLVLVFYN